DIEISDPDTFEINLEKLYYNKLIKFKNDILLINIAKIKNGLLQYNKYINKSKNNKKQLMVNMISITNLIKYNEVLIGNDIYLFGYPTSIGLTMNGAIQFDKNRPLLRKGIIAGKYNDNKTIIIDCPSYYGNSGGPVICFFYSNKKYIIPNIIGINIQFIPYVETWKNIRNNLTREEWSNSGYSVVESSDKIIEILEDFKKNGK
nr:hypothetical protein [Bacteroidales bacterium]